MKSGLNIALALALLGLISCTTMVADGSGSEAGNSDAVIAASCFIELPTSVAKPPVSGGMSKRTASRSTGQPFDLYEGVRECVGLANELVHNKEFGVVTIIRTWHNSLNWAAIRRIGLFTRSENGMSYTASYCDTRSFPYQLMIRRTDLTGEPIALLIDYNGDKERPRGRVFVFLDLVNPTFTQGLRYSVAFGVSDSGRTLDVQISSDRVEENARDAVQNIRLELWEKGGLVHMSGAAYLPSLDSLLPDTTGHCYVFTGVADTAQNRGMINLGLPPAVYAKSDSTVFTTYGVADIFGKWFLRNGIPQLEDTVKSIIVTSYTDSLTYARILDSIAKIGNADFLHPASNASAMTLDDLKYVLRLNCDMVDSTTRKDFEGILWLLDLKQPVFFNAKGYAGNGDIPPTGFSYLAESPVSLAPQAPYQVRQLRVTP